MMLSSAGQHGNAARYRQLGVSGILTKPVRQLELRTAILAALGSLPLPEMEARPAAQDSLRKPPQPLRILLAEDNPVNQMLAVALLEKRGHTVEVAQTGREVLTRLEDSTPPRFDLVLMDVQMPELDGFETTAAIREKEKTTGKHLCIVAMTAHALKSDEARCLAAGMDAYISKPFRPDELIKVIEDHAWPADARRTPSRAGENLLPKTSDTQS
jgi:two-component system, sensor histidine kinase and response regulator